MAAGGGSGYDANRHDETRRGGFRRGVRRFRSAQEMPGLSRRPPLDPENIRLALGMAALAHGLRPLRMKAGVRKFEVHAPAADGKRVDAHSRGEQNVTEG